MMATTLPGSFFQLFGACHTDGGGKRRAAVPRNKGITVTFLRGGKARKAVHLAQMGEALPAAGQQLVGIALVTDIEQNFILRQSQRTVQSHRKFHHAQVGRKVPAGRGNTFNQKLRISSHRSGSSCCGSFFTSPFSGFYPDKDIS